jgi:DUF4097 and DUF4098 domain-containing protein YvlB
MIDTQPVAAPPGGDPPAMALAAHQSRPVARGALLVVGALTAVLLAMAAGLQAVAATSGRVYRDERVTLPAAVTTLEVDTSSGDVVLTGTSARQGVVDAQLSGTVRTPSLHVQIAGDTARLSADCGAFVLLTCDATMRVTVPAGVSVRARSSSGDITATGLTSSFDLGTSSGDITASGGAGSARLSTSSGDVHATALGAATVDARTSSGSVTVGLTVVPEKVSAHSSSGDVRITVPDGPTAYRVSASTSSGDSSVRVRTDPTSPRRISASTSSGNVIVAYQPATGSS